MIPHEASLSPHLVSGTLLELTSRLHDVNDREYRYRCYQKGHGISAVPEQEHPAMGAAKSSVLPGDCGVEVIGCLELSILRTREGGGA